MLTDAEWQAKIKERGLEHKYDKQLDDLEEFYPIKIARITELIIGGEITEEDTKRLLAKIERLTDKLATVTKEKEFRGSKEVVRTPVGTIYYIDYINGNDASDGLSAPNAWKTIHKYTTITVRSAGDIGKLRANTTWDYGAAGEATDINFDEDGTAASLITLKGCDSVDDPWSDGSDVKPIIDFGDADYNFSIYDDWRWKIQNLEVIQSSDSYGAFEVYYAFNIKFEDCVIRDNAKGIYTNATLTNIDNCSFYGNVTYSIQASNSKLFVENSTFNGGVATTNYGIYNFNSIIFLDTCTFGGTTTHDDASIYFYRPPASFLARNCTFTDAAEVEFGIDSLGSNLKSEDHDATKGAQKVYYKHGIITRDTGVTHAGGASSSAKMMPSSACGIYQPLSLADDYLAGDFKIWVPASAITITIYMRSEGAWGTYPTATQLFIQASYLNHAANATRSKSTASTQVLSDATTWVAFTTTFTPAQAGWVYVHLNLGKYEASKGIYIDIKPIVS